MTDLSKFDDSNIDNVISDFQIQLEEIKKSSLEQKTRTSIKFDINEQLQNDNKKYKSQIKLLKAQLTSQDNEIKLYKTQIEALTHQQSSLELSKKDKENEYKDQIAKLLSSNEEQIKNLTQDHQIKEELLNDTINTKDKEIELLKASQSVLLNIKEQVIAFYDEIKPLIIREDNTNQGKEDNVLQSQNIVLKKKQKDVGISKEENQSKEMIDDLRGFIHKLIDDNQLILNQFAQYQKDTNEQKEANENQYITELKYENEMLKQQINQLINDNIKQKYIDNTLTLNSCKQIDSLQLTDDNKQTNHYASYTTEDNLYQKDLDSISRVKSKLNDLTQRIKGRRDQLS